MAVDSKNKRKRCNFCDDKVSDIEYTDVNRIKKYLTDRGKILPRRITGTCAHHQRLFAIALKRARTAALIPYIMEG